MSSIRKTFGVMALGLTAVFMAGAGMEAGYQTSPSETLRVTVVEKTTVPAPDGEKNHRTFIVKTDRETFENTDSTMRGKFNATALQAELQPGVTYDLTVYGYASRFLGIHRNIERVTPVKPPAGTPPQA